MGLDPENASALECADDAFLVARARDGDVRAFGLLLRRHDRTLHGYVGRLTRNAADTDDVLQETALIAWRRLDTIAEPAKVRAWLIRIATREALRVVTARPAHVELPDESALAARGDQEPQRVDLQQDLRAALDALPQQQARCWVLRELGGYTYAEIGEHLAIPESTVRGALAAARKSILARMGGHR
ncbi:RNA polymerase sigma factor [uncultured Amnibacterium sp.]|uniref:RNA polymerase sigma factor n=1 Tax=uncultured Amnibacterium sp. TaxID=1631851 RepID=UPI0035C95F26